MGSSPCRRIHLLGIAHPVVGKHFQVLKVHRGMECIRDPSGEEKARYGLVFVLCKLWVENPIFVLYKEQRVVIKLVLYDKYILTSFLGFRLSCNRKTKLR